MKVYYPERIDHEYFNMKEDLNEDDADADDDIIISAIVKVFSDNISHAEHILSTLNSKVNNKIS